MEACPHFRNRNCTSTSSSVQEFTRNWPSTSPLWRKLSLIPQTLASKHLLRWKIIATSVCFLPWSYQIGISYFLIVWNSGIAEFRTRSLREQPVSYRQYCLDSSIDLAIFFLYFFLSCFIFRIREFWYSGTTKKWHSDSEIYRSASQLIYVIPIQNKQCPEKNCIFELEIFISYLKTKSFATLTWKNKQKESM